MRINGRIRKGGAHKREEEKKNGKQSEKEGKKRRDISKGTLGQDEVAC